MSTKIASVKQLEMANSRIKRDPEPLLRSAGVPTLTAMPTSLLISRAGYIETWTLNRPEQRNPITDDEMVDALVHAAQRVAADESVRAIVLTGSGFAFSSGGNLKAMAARQGMFGAGPSRLADGYRHGVQRIPRALRACDVPLIAAVNGPAVGAGCDLALMCDLRIASTTAFFAESFVKVGIIPGDGGLYFLPRVVGHARAAEMALTGESVDAQTALEWGLVSQVVLPADSLPAANALAARVAANPPLAVRRTKQMLREITGHSLDSVLQESAHVQAGLHQTQEHREAVSSFLSRSTRS
ncbi:crotonase/enoyl-CoA hydratase family protein [Nocardioides sp. DS6]|uniref:Crotonase/enoyl-CoA hydratase family protein n=1 Tax=Nocardioides eburneus TaxID=3231482 RepID=A0ABV3SXP1_9ACTN